MVSFDFYYNTECCKKLSTYLKTFSSYQAYLVFLHLVLFSSLLDAISTTSSTRRNGKGALGNLFCKHF